MIDLTPLDVRNKRGDFKKGMRGYDPQEVDVFLELVAERLEALVRENIQLRDRTQTLQEQVDAQSGREQAVQDALVTAQELRKDIREQSQREADHVMREAESEARRMIAEADAEVRSRLRGVERQIDHSRDSLRELERRRSRFLQDFRTLLQRELDVVEVEEERTPLEDRPIDLDLGGSRRKASHGSRDGKEPADSTVESASTTGSGSDAAGEAGAGSGEGSDDESLDDDVGELADRDEGNAPSAGAEASSDDPATADGAAAAGAPEPEGGADGASRPDEGVTVDVSELHPSADASRPIAPPPSVGDEPSSLELELIAGAEGASGGTEDGATERSFPEVPDLETVLAEAGVDEVSPPPSEEISPPPAERRPEDRLALFDKDEKKKKG